MFVPTGVVTCHWWNHIWNSSIISGALLCIIFHLFVWAGGSVVHIFKKAVFTRQHVIMLTSSCNCWLVLLSQVLYQQFKFFLNLYFLVVACSQFVPSLKIGYLYTYWAPLVTLSALFYPLYIKKKFNLEKLFDLTNNLRHTLKLYLHKFWIWFCKMNSNQFLISQHTWGLIVPWSC